MALAWVAQEQVRAPKAVGAPCLKAQTSWCQLALMLEKNVWRGSQFVSHCIGRGGLRDSEQKGTRMHDVGDVELVSS